MSGVPLIHRALAAGFLALGVVNFFFAGLGAFGETTYAAHEGTGSLLMVLAAVLAVLAVVGRREALQASVGLTFLMLLQVLLAVAGEEIGVLGGLHPVNGLLVLFAAHQAWQGRPLRL